MENLGEHRIGFRNILFLAISLLVFGIIAIVDISFYHVPSFIKNFHTEREIILILAFLGMIPFLRSVSGKFQLNPKKDFYFTSGLLLTAIFIVSLIQLFGNNFINLWNNNPLLAENPDSWVVFSTFMTIFTGSILVIILYNIHYLVIAQTGKKSDLLFKICILFIIIFSLTLNAYEDHYSYKQLGNELPIDDLSRYAWIILGGGLFITNSFKNNWIERLTSREKIVTLITIIITLGITLYFYLSPLITKLYALSITMKGFILSAMAFVIIYLFMATLKLLFHIPLIGYHEQIENELQAVRDISELISRSNDENLVLKKIIEHITKITDAQICWIESGLDGQYNILSSNNIAEDRAQSISKIARSRINQEKDLYYFDLSRNEIRDYLSDLDKKWKFLIIVPFKTDDTSTILYLISTKRSAFKTRNVTSLKTFLSFLKIIRDKDNK